MWPLIRSALLRPQAIVVLALLLLVTDALLSIFSPASAAAHPDRPHPASFPSARVLLAAPHDDDDWLLPVPPAGNSLQPFPTAELPALGQVTLGGTTCAPKAPLPIAAR